MQTASECHAVLFGRVSGSVLDCESRVRKLLVEPHHESFSEEASRNFEVQSSLAHSKFGHWGVDQEASRILLLNASRRTQGSPGSNKANLQNEASHAFHTVLQATSRCGNDDGPI